MQHTARCLSGQNQIIKDDACMKCYDETKSLYIETDLSGVGLGAALLQTRSNNSCPRVEAPNNSVPRPVTLFQQKPDWSRKRYSNIEERH